MTPPRGQPQRYLFLTQWVRSPRHGSIPPAAYKGGGTGASPRHHPARALASQSFLFRGMSCPEPYTVQADPRGDGCYDARFDPLGCITNADMDGIAIGVTSKSWSQRGYSPSVSELTDVRCGCQRLFKCVEVHNWILLWIEGQHSLCIQES